MGGSKKGGGIKGGGGWEGNEGLEGDCIPQGILGHLNKSKHSLSSYLSISLSLSFSLSQCREPKKIIIFIIHIAYIENNLFLVISNILSYRFFLLQNNSTE